jgi:hypothetical protein
MESFKHIRLGPKSPDHEATLNVGVSVYYTYGSKHVAVWSDQTIVLVCTQYRVLCIPT